MVHHHSKRALYLVATPIGNLDDITFRAIDVLKTVDIIAAEDTRHSKRLLTHYAITTPVISLHEHNEQKRADELIARLQQGQSIALISDAGTPLISDPGARTVALIVAAGLAVIPIPGPCAVISALVASGLPSDRFHFIGFLPHKGAERLKHLEALALQRDTLVLYESVHRIVNLLQCIIDVLGAERLICVAREMTKAFETFYYGSALQVQQQVQRHPEQQKGEYVIIIAGCDKPSDASQVNIDVTQLLSSLLQQMPLKTTVNLAVELTGLRRNQLYDLALTLSKGDRQ